MQGHEGRPFNNKLGTHSPIARASANHKPSSSYHRRQGLSLADHPRLQASDNFKVVAFLCTLNHMVFSLLHFSYNSLINHKDRMRAYISYFPSAHGLTVTHRHGDWWRTWSVIQVTSGPLSMDHITSFAQRIKECLGRSS